jgi:aldehyde:ferredoxin oxidoreductase
MGLAYATSERGACHARTTFYKAELAGISPPDEIEGKAAHFIDFEDRMSLMDALILCRFYRDLYSWEEFSTILRLTTGMDVDRAGLENIARNIKSEAHNFNLREGATRADDILPSRFFQESLKDSGKTCTVKTFDRLMNDYYSLRRWKKD